MYFGLLIQMQKILPAMTTPIQSYQKQRQVKDSSCQTDLSLKDIQELERCRKKMDSKDELLRDLFVSKVTDSDRGIQQYTGLPSKPVFEGIFSEFKYLNTCMQY
jgi:hypothetical protein